MWGLPDLLHAVSARGGQKRLSNYIKNNDNSNNNNLNKNNKNENNIHKNVFNLDDYG